ncbi:SDR family NAD(P)-dependent oxidoreductase [Planctobacterium marinum]|uniref:SDR family NAD(P)-dependent oxidoreductase n=1 Tax=Planctobacterium marinum TaxID=1631968 RepID=UPI001E284944|nr:SDR family oxidoreductase [Planctobacterium marinum]MCC2603858.1 SDR family oxidoreductase [Planctobacterium marinum]
MRFKDKVVLITGGNSGIGLSAAKQFARDGAKVVISGRRRNVLDDITGSHANIYGVVADAADPDSAQVVIDYAVTNFGRIDVLVNNVGAGCIGGIEQLPFAAITDVFNINVLYAIKMIQKSLPYLEQVEGNIVNLSSTYGHKAAPFLSVYGLSKAAIEHLTKSLAIELAFKHVRVNAVAPGPTESEFLQARMNLSPEEIVAVKKTEIAKIPLGRRGVPDDVAHWVVELAASTGSWITGQIVDVDGGLSIS